MKRELSLWLWINIDHAKVKLLKIHVHAKMELLNIRIYWLYVLVLVDVYLRKPFVLCASFTFSRATSTLLFVIHNNSVVSIIFSPTSFQHIEAMHFDHAKSSNDEHAKCFSVMKHLDQSHFFYGKLLTIYFYVTSLMFHMITLFLASISIKLIKPL